MATTVRRLLGPADHGTRLTLEEFEQTDVKPGYRYELGRGVFEVGDIPDEFPEGMLICWFYEALGCYSHDRPGRIHCFGGAANYRLVMPTFESARHPDVSMTLVGTPKNPRGRHPPTLAIEIVSSGREERDRDYRTKREEYLAYGLAEYWIVDPYERLVVVHLRDGDAWVERVFTKPEDSASGLVLPGFMAPLAELWKIGEER